MKRLESYLFTACLLGRLVVPGFGQTLKVEPIANPSGATSLQAHWGTAQDGSPLLSWVETLKDGSHMLRYAIRRGAQWSEPRTIATNRHFFRQPAESPSVISFADGSLLAEWVEIPPASSEAEYMYVSASKDGVKWTSPVMAHQDRSPVQHALVSMAASGDREASLVWLEALKGEDAPSALKRTVVSSDGKVMKEESLDPDVCTCCPTSIVKTSRGLLVAYRDHTPQDIRDIAVIRFENGRWLPSKILNPEKWEINACPVNGASAVAKDNRVAMQRRGRGRAPGASSYRRRGCWCRNASCPGFEIEHRLSAAPAYRKRDMDCLGEFRSRKDTNGSPFKMRSTMKRAIVSFRRASAADAPFCV